MAQIQGIDNMIEDEIENLSLHQYERLQYEAMRKNAWSVSEEVRSRIDDAPVMHEHIKAYLTKPTDEQFIFNSEELDKFQNTNNIEAKIQLPGGAYIMKVMDFISSHYKEGELFMEYIKLGCLESKDTPCDFCTDHPWIGPPTTRVPQPVRDAQNTMHYLPLEETH